MVKPVYSDYPLSIQERFNQLERIIAAVTFFIVAIIVIMTVVQTNIIRDLHDIVNVEAIE